MVETKETIDDKQNIDKKSVDSGTKPADTGDLDTNKGFFAEMKETWNNWIKSYKPEESSTSTGVAQGDKQGKEDNATSAGGVSRAEWEALQKQLQAVEEQIKKEQKQT